MWIVMYTSFISNVRCFLFPNAVSYLMNNAYMGLLVHMQKVYAEFYTYLTWKASDQENNLSIYSLFFLYSDIQSKS